MREGQGSLRDGVEAGGGVLCLGPDSLDPIPTPIPPGPEAEGRCPCFGHTGGSPRYSWTLRALC